MSAQRAGTDTHVLWRENAVDQLGFVVEDLEQSIDYYWRVLGIGPFYYTRRTDPRPVTFRGESIDLINSSALAFAGGTQIELIEQHCSTPSSYREFLHSNGPGLHHIARFTSSYPVDERRLAAGGMSEVMGGRAGNDIRYSYWEHPGHVAGSPLLELVSLGEDIRGVIGMMKSASETWDGVTDPVREYGSFNSYAVAGTAD